MDISVSECYKQFNPNILIDRQTDRFDIPSYFGCVPSSVDIYLRMCSVHPKPCTALPRSYGLVMDFPLFSALIMNP